MLQDFIIIGQSDIPISTAAPTHYVRFYTHTFPIHFGKIWALFGAPGALTFYFPIPLLPLRIHIFFPTFRLFSHFLLQGSLVHLHPGLVVILLTSNRGDQPLARRPYMARILFHLKDAYATISPYFQPPDDY